MSQRHFQASIAGIKLAGFACNASGPMCTTLNELKDLGTSGSAAIVMKSCTLEAREGNPEPRYARLPSGVIQSMGLPNLGYQEYIRFSHILKEEFPNKPIIASVAGLDNIGDYLIMVNAFQEEGAVDLIEVNLSCPNIPGKPQIAYDMETVERLLVLLSEIGEKPIGLKLPAYPDLSFHRKMAELIRRYEVRFITCINSIGHALAIDPENETTLIAPNRGLGGLSGEYILNVALGNVRIFYELLHGADVSIFGVGGIGNEIDAFKFLLAGADGVQIGTTFMNEGPGCFGRINRGLESLLKRKGYGSIEEARGRLKIPSDKKG